MLSLHLSVSCCVCILLRFAVACCARIIWRAFADYFLGRVSAMVGDFIITTGPCQLHNAPIPRHKYNVLSGEYDAFAAKANGTLKLADNNSTHGTFLAGKPRKPQTWMPLTGRENFERRTLNSNFSLSRQPRKVFSILDFAPKSDFGLLTR